MNDYAMAKRLVVLTDKDVHVNWLKYAPSLNLTNGAFRIYYDAYNRASKATGKLYSEMHADLNSAAREGVGFGMYSGDLMTVFQTLWWNQKQWHEDYGDNYCGPQISGAIPVPVGVKNFLDAVDKRSDALQKNFQSFSQYAKEIAQAKANNKWSEIGKATEYMKQVLENTQPLLWFLPVSHSASSGHEFFSKWNEGFGMVYSFLDNFNKFNTSVGMSQPQAAVVSAFMIMIGKGVPILGDVYVKALETLPSLITWARNIKRDQDNAIRQAIGAGNY
jgi:hypothetical protein